MRLWHKEDLLNRVYVNVDGNKKASMPRYYKDKIYTPEERIKIARHGEILFQEAEHASLEQVNSAFERMRYMEITSQQKL